MTLTDLADVLARDLGAETAARVAAALVRHAPSETLYIPRRLTPPRVLPTDTVATLRSRYGCSRRTAYSWLADHRAHADHQDAMPQ